MALCKDKRSTMPAKVTCGFFIRIIQIMDKLLKCSDRTEGLRDLVYIRMPNNATRGIPAWMFDETICASIRCADRPTIDCGALLRLAQMLDLQAESRGIGGHESLIPESKIASKISSSSDDTGAREVAFKRSDAKRRS